MKMTKEKMENLKTICSYHECFQTYIENALENPQWIREMEKIQDFMHYDLIDVYLHLGQVEEGIHDTKVSKKTKKKQEKIK